jgi:hypothetical protein
VARLLVDMGVYMRPLLPHLAIEITRFARFATQLQRGLGIAEMAACVSVQCSPHDRREVDKWLNRLPAHGHLCAARGIEVGDQSALFPATNNIAPAAALSYSLPSVMSCVKRSRRAINFTLW